MDVSGGQLTFAVVTVFAVGFHIGHRFMFWHITHCCRCAAKLKAVYPLLHEGRCNDTQKHSYHERDPPPSPPHAH